jgi:hypothetical protein
MAIYSGFSHWKWWFSIVMLVYQRVNPLVVEDSYWTWTIAWFFWRRSWLNPTSVTFECQSLEGVCGWLSRRANTGGGLGRGWGLLAHFQVIFVKSCAKTQLCSGIIVVLQDFFLENADSRYLNLGHISATFGQNVIQDWRLLTHAMAGLTLW